MLNSEQQGHVNSLARMPRKEICPCGWYSEKECQSACFTGDRTSAPALLRRVQQLYKQIDHASEAKDDEIARLRAALDAMTAERDAANARAQEAAIDALAAQGQAAEANDARIKAEAERDAARAKALEDAAACVDETARSMRNVASMQLPVMSPVVALDRAITAERLAAAIRAMIHTQGDKG